MTGLSFVALSCTMEPAITCTDNKARGAEEVELTVDVSFGMTTRASEAAEEYENTVDSFQIFIYDGEKLQTTGYSYGSDITLKCYRGNFDVFAVVNLPEIDWKTVTSESDLKQIVTHFTGSDTRCVMFGKTTLDLTESSSTSQSVNVSVVRMCARVIVECVSNYTLLTANGVPIKILSMYMLNVTGDADLGAAVGSSDYEPQEWINLHENTETKAGFLYSGAINETLETETTKHYNTPQYFYCYPNPTETDSASLPNGNNSARYTRVVVEAEYDGDLCYYAVSLPLIKSGYTYDITRIEIEQKGTNTPDWRSVTRNSTSISKVRTLESSEDKTVKLEVVF